MSGSQTATLPPDYEERVYAGWLGKCAGVRLGAPLEGWTYEEIRDHLGHVDAFLPLPPGTLFKPDDDTALPMILIRALEEYGPQLTAQQMGETWLNYLGDQRGTLWWGGYGVSTEHTAYLNLLHGIPAPRSGSLALNGAVLAEQIGGQIFSDIWGLVAPNNPALAAHYAALAASVSHDGAGIEGGRFIAALVSAAFGETDPRRLIEAGLGVISPDGEYARVVRAVCDFHHSAPDDWHSAYHFLAANFGYDRYPGMVHIIPNAGVVVLALLYGGGDFSRTLQIATMAGWDTDCNVGNVGAIMGVAVGLDGIAAHWREPMNDILVAASVIGTRNLLDIPCCARLFARLGRQLAGAEPLAPAARYTFDLPGATHGFEADPDSSAMIVRQQPHNGGGVLQATVRKLKKKGEARFYVRTHLLPHDLSANYYGASFSPLIYPGQTLRARLFLPAAAPRQLRAALYVWDGNAGQVQQAEAQPLQPGSWHDLSFTLPPQRGARLDRAGIVLRNLAGEPWTGSVWLDDVGWEGRPHFTYDFGSAREIFGGISQWTVFRGYWRLQDGACHGSGYSLNESYSGDIDWQDYRLSVRLSPLLGDLHQINVRVRGSRHSYALALAAGSLALYKNEGGYRRLLSAPFSWEHGSTYDLWLSAEGNRLQGGVTGGPQLEWVDRDAPYEKGQIGLSNGPGCHTRYEEVRLE